jgi:hypothetical protein
MKAGQKVWLVKYALTDGITEEVVQSTSGDHACMENRSWNFYKIGCDVFADHGEAVKAAEALRQKKLGSLRKQCMRLEKLKF